MRLNPARVAVLRLFAVLLVLVVGAAACGSGADESSAGAEPSEDADAGFPVRVGHRYGTTEVSSTPKRIVVVGLTEQDALLALGVKPVAVTEWFGGHPHATWPWARDELGDAQPVVLTDTSGINFEKVADLEPDVILAIYSGLTKKDYDTLSKIAPTVAQPKGVVDYGAGWQDLTRTVGKVVGKPEQANALVDDVEAKFAQVRAEHPEFAGKTAVMATPYEGVYVYGPEDARGRFLTSIGFHLPDGLEAVAGKDFGGDLSEEQVDLLDTDAIVWLDPEEAEGDIGGPLYQTLAVHTEGREVFLDSESEDALGGATSFVTVLSLPFLLDGIVPRLSAAVDGDPATAVPLP